MKRLVEAISNWAFLGIAVTWGATADTCQAADYMFETNNGTITIRRYIGSGGEVIIPSMITGLPVTTIGDYAFNSITTVTSVTIPDTVTSIRYDGFHGCSGLTNVTIGAGVTNIAEAAFYGCVNLPAVLIPGTVKSIGTRAFSSCTNLREATIGNGVPQVGGGMFQMCVNLRTVAIPNSVTNIGLQAFYYCTNLTTVVADGVTGIGNFAFGYCFNLTNVMVGKGLTSLGSLTFERCAKLTEAYFRGDAPVNVGTDVFRSNTTATVYYLPGTAGWGASIGGRPTALWRPQIQTDDGSFGAHNNQFGFNIAWCREMNIAVDACTDLVNPDWLPLKTNILTADTSYFSDEEWAEYPRRFYRVRWP